MFEEGRRNERYYIAALSFSSISPDIPLSRGSSPLNGYENYYTRRAGAFWRPRLFIDTR